MDLYTLAAPPVQILSDNNDEMLMKIVIGLVNTNISQFHLDSIELDIGKSFYDRSCFRAAFFKLRRTKVDFRYYVLISAECLRKLENR